MYIFDAFLQRSLLKTKQEFNYWTGQNFIRQSASEKPELGNVLFVDNLPRPYEVIGFGCHKPNDFEPVIDIIKLKMLP